MVVEMECCGSETLELKTIRIAHNLYFVKLKSGSENHYYAVLKL